MRVDTTANYIKTGDIITGYREQCLRGIAYYEAFLITPDQKVVIRKFNKESNAINMADTLRKQYLAGKIQGEEFYNPKGEVA